MAGRFFDTSKISEFTNLLIELKDPSVSFITWLTGPKAQAGQTDLNEKLYNDVITLQNKLSSRSISEEEHIYLAKKLALCSSKFESFKQFFKMCNVDFTKDEYTKILSIFSENYIQRDYVGSSEFKEFPKDPYSLAEDIASGLIYFRELKNTCKLTSDQIFLICDILKRDTSRYERFRAAVLGPVIMKDISESLLSLHKNGVKLTNEVIELISNASKPIELAASLIEQKEQDVPSLAHTP